MGLMPGSVRPVFLNSSKNDIVISRSRQAGQMESLESRLDRLSPEQRREVEDFVDFMLQKSKTPLSAPSSPAAAPPPLTAASPPVFEPEPASVPEPVKLHDLIRRKEPVAASPQEDVASLVQEISIGDDDPLSGDYMDYGQFDQEKKAVMQKKQKKGREKATDSAARLLEWIE
jgi:hypothetical protein